VSGDVKKWLKQMNFERRLSWFFLGVLVALVGVLGVLQYRWIGEISQMEKKKLEDYLQSSLNEVGRDFNWELSNALRPLLPTEAEVSQLGRNEAYLRRYAQWKNSSANSKLFARIRLGWEQDGQPAFQTLNLENGSMESADRQPDDPPSVHFPRFGGAPGERDWLIAEVDPHYAAETVLPELLARHFGSNYRDEYEIEIYSQDARSTRRLDQAAASVGLFEGAPPMPERHGHGPGPFGPGPPPGPPPGRGRWRLSIRLKAGSLEAVVARARTRNLAISGAILLLMLASAAALVRFTRQAQRLAEMEMEFVAGVSHELGTPLSVIRTAAFNLRGKLSLNPSQVAIYGALIQEQSEKLTAIVEQILRFAGAKAGRVIRERQPVSVEGLIDASLESSRGLLEENLCQVEKQVEPGLPAILGDSVALRHALQNLIGNALKYGMEGGNWIGVFARGVGGEGAAAVEIRVSDHGPGIPAEERKHIFDAFVRGKRAIRDQIHGTGLGLNLVKKIVEAHGGTVQVESQAGVGTTFIVRIPCQQSLSAAGVPSGVPT
jgi:signal transduction histidine kinase